MLQYTLTKALNTLYLKIMTQKKYKILIIAEAANPEWASVPLIGWSLSNAIQKKSPDSLIVTQVRNREAWIRAGAVENKDFIAIDSEKIAIFTNKISSFVRGKSNKAWTIDTAFASLSYYYFEYLVWKKFKKLIKNGEFDLVHRITPLSPTAPSLIAKKCIKSNVPFIIGPLNGGVPWPKEFNEVRHQEKEWLSYIREAYKLLPGYKQTLKYSSAIIAGSKFTLGAFPKYAKDKSFFIPENGIDPSRFNLKKSSIKQSQPLKICFVGRLVPYKGAKILLESCLALLNQKKVSIDLIGDGPELASLKDYVQENNIANSVRFHGWVEHKKVQLIMSECDVLGFPSIREFGGGVVLEAMALGLVPVIVDYAGPGELVDLNIGYKVPMSTRQDIVNNFNIVMTEIVNNPADLAQKSENCVTRINDKFTWEKKAMQIHHIYNWLLSSKTLPKPNSFD